MAVTSLERGKREVVLGGQPFGAAGPYEKIAGVLRFAVDPVLPIHRTITDLGVAPRNGAGRVEFSAELAEDVEAVVERAGLLWDYLHAGRDTQ